MGRVGRRRPRADATALYNPELQWRRHDPDEEYARRWIPELDDGYPEPVVDHAVERRAAIAAYRAAKL